MAISRKPEYADVEELWLDPNNPRIGRENRKAQPDQERLLKIMSEWTLDELIDSFLTSGGFWAQEALIVVKEHREGEERLIVVEGNRRLAALKLLWNAVTGQAAPRFARERAVEAGLDPEHHLFKEIPYLLAESRADIDAYLGFRHVTGIKQWHPAEKAEFIAHLIDDTDCSYQDVARKIGSRADNVRQHYLAFKILVQMEGILDLPEWAAVEDKFSVLFLSLRSEGVRNFLGVDFRLPPRFGHDPVPQKNRDELVEFVGWLFGGKSGKSFVKESRDVDRFGEILAEPRAVEYLRSSPDPQFEVAYSMTKSSASVVIELFKSASRNIDLALRELEPNRADPTVHDEAWPVVAGGIQVAHVLNGRVLERAKEFLVGNRPS